MVYNMTIFGKVFCSESYCKNPPFWKYLKFDIYEDNDDVHPSFFALLGSSWKVYIVLVCNYDFLRDPVPESRL